MKITDIEMNDWHETVEEMIRVVMQYARLDIPAGPNLYEFYSQIRNIPYQRDSKKAEVVSRPAYLLTHFLSLDCKKKAVLLAAYAEAHNMPWRFAVVGEKKAFSPLKPHHIYPEIEINSRWIPTDATFPDRSTFGLKMYREDFRKVFPRPEK